MCLWIKSNQERNERDLNKWFGNRKKFAYVYKVLRKRPDEDFYRSLVKVDFKWDFKNQKIFQVNRPLKPTFWELSDRKIDEGFHIYTSLKEAKRRKGSYGIIIKFRVRKENIVAVDNDWDREKDNFKQAVCTKLEFVKVLED
jgi:hypothetical protein